MEGKVAECPGLYSTSLLVVEVCGPESLKKLLAENNNVIMVFYASWCGHCQHFAPKFKSIAEKTLRAREDLNNQKLPLLATDERISLFSNITFAALDCVNYHELCESYKLDAYPSIIPFNFSNKKEKGAVIHGREEEILKFLKTHYFKGEIETAELRKYTSSKSSALPSAASLHPKSINPSSNSKDITSSNPVASNILVQSHVTDAKTRWKDALASFYYFLRNEIPSQFPQIRFELLKDWITVVAQITNDQKLKEILQKFQDQNAVIIESFASRNISRPINVLTGNQSNPQRVIKNMIHQVISDKDIQWVACGVPIPSTSSKQLRQVSSVTNGSHREARFGYSCGLWMLFHGITVNYQRLESFQSFYDAKKLMSLLYGFIAEFFGCIDCRAHFLQYYNHCLFQRCQIQSNDFQSLQLWLHQLHNFITIRIMYEKRNHHFFTPEAIHEGVQVLWPSRQHCPQCYSSTIDALLTEESMTQFVTNLTSLQVNHKYHKQEIDNGLMTLLPLLFPKLFSTPSTILHLQQSFLLP